MRGLTLGLFFGVLGGLLAHHWELVVWFGVIGAAVDFVLVFASKLWVNLRGQDNEWIAVHPPHPSLSGDAVLQLIRQDGRNLEWLLGVACEVRDPSGLIARREGDRHRYIWATDFPELRPKKPGRYDVTWWLRSKRGKWVLLLRDHFELDASTQLTSVTGRGAS